MRYHEGSTFTFLVSSSENARLSPTVTNVLQAWTLLESVCFLNKTKKKYLSVFVDGNLTSLVKILRSVPAAIQNQIQRCT